MLQHFYARIGYGISYGNSVCPSCLSRPGTDRSPGETGDFWFTPYDSLESLVFRVHISCSWERGFLSSEGVKRAPPLKKRFTAVGSSSVKMVADRQRHAAYHNKHWRRGS